MGKRGIHTKPTGDNPTAATGGPVARPRFRHQAGNRPADDAQHAERTERRQFVVDLMVAALVLLVLGASAAVTIVLIAKLFA